MAERAHPDSKSFKDKFFGLVTNKFKENLYKRYLLCNEYVQNKIVLDVPCGMGWGTSLISGYKKCFGVDIDKGSIIEANKKYKSSNLFFKEGNLTQIPFDDNFFDVLICLEGFEHITFLEGQKFLLEAKRVLKKEGLLILSTPLLRENKYHSGNIYHLCEYKREELYLVLNEMQFKIKHETFLPTPENTQVIIVVCENG
jgi:ubiquinone/menaquinone biosynthesis C-methylase UbiE